MRAFYCRPEEEVVADLTAAGAQGGHDAILVAVRAAQVAFGCISDEQAHAGGSMKVTRVQAPLTDPNDPSTDPSPDSLDPNVPVSGPQ